jgi:leucine dehydrogenase
MSIFEAPDFDGHEQVLFVKQALNDGSGAELRAIIAIHNTRLGPALGGCRMWPYANEAAAIRDVLRLSRGMTYKSAVLDCGLGGGKSVIIGDPYQEKTPQLLHAMGRAIDSLNERYIVGEDIGTNPMDMREIRQATRCVSCLEVEDGGYGDPAPMTALGVFSAIQAGLEQTMGSKDLDGVRVAVQGVGNVGLNLCRLLDQAGARLTVCDVHEANLQTALEEFGAQAVAPDEIYQAEVDVFAPCAMGAILNDVTIPQLRARVVAGAANNQLDRDEHGATLSGRGIAYLPDYVANGGGLISCAAEWYGEDIGKVPADVRGIYKTCKDILELADESGLTTSAAADRIAEARFNPPNGTLAQ